MTVSSRGNASQNKIFGTTPSAERAKIRNGELRVIGKQFFTFWIVWSIVSRFQNLNVQKNLSPNPPGEDPKKPYAYLAPLSPTRLLRPTYSHFAILDSLRPTLHSRGLT